MRSLLVAAAAAVACIASAAVACIASAASAPGSAAVSPSPSPAPTRELRVGDEITQTALLGYLAQTPRSGDWARHQISFGAVRIDQTVGFGSETIDDRPRPFIEISAARHGVAWTPVPLSWHAGGASIAKTYLDADAFAAPDAHYRALATVLEIGDSAYRIDYRHAQPPQVLANAPPSRLTLVAPLLTGDLLTGRILEIAEQELTVNGRSMRVTRITALFGSALGGALPQTLLRVWQSPDVPLGTVAVRAEVSGRELRIDLVDFGHGAYVSRIKQALNDIPRLPGSH